MIILTTLAIYGLVPLFLDRFRSKITGLVSVLAGACPHIFILVFEGKVSLPEHEISELVAWSFLVLSGPLFMLCAIRYKIKESRKAFIAATLGAVFGVLVSLYTWSKLWGFGV